MNDSLLMQKLCGCPWQASMKLLGWIHPPPHVDVHTCHVILIVKLDVHLNIEIRWMPVATRTSASNMHAI